MTTPRFKISQDKEYIYIDINVPYIRISNCDFYIEETLFSFYCKPYFLKLHLPKPIVDDDRAKAVYNLEEDNGTIHVTAPKKTPGEHFEDLQMLTKLLSKSSTLNIVDNANKLKNVQGRNLIEVISSSRNEEEEEEDNKHGKIADDNNNNNNNKKNSNIVKQNNADASATAVTTPSILLLNKDNDGNANNNNPTMEELTKSINNITLKTTITYGFNNRFSNFFTGLRDELVEIIELAEPDKIPIKQRSVLRIEKEEETFDLERYAGDYAYGKEDPIYKEAMRMKPFWIAKKKKEMKEDKKKSMKNKDNSNDHNNKKEANDDDEKEKQEEFNETEREILIRLPRREYLINENEETYKLLCGLASILYGFAYDFRLVNGEPNVESSWTISTLSPLLSWLDECNNNIEQMLISCMRRSLIYPYLRSYELSKMIVKDVIAIFQLGKHTVLQTLLKIYKIYEKSETKYMINKLFIEDYCVWVQTINDDIIKGFAKEIQKVDINKSKLDLELEYIEEQVNEQLQQS